VTGLQTSVISQHTLVGSEIIIIVTDDYAILTYTILYSRSRW